jgi:hypothetical protein
LELLLEGFGGLTGSGGLLLRLVHLAPKVPDASGRLPKPIPQPGLTTCSQLSMKFFQAFRFWQTDLFRLFDPLGFQ